MLVVDVMACLKGSVCTGWAVAGFYGYMNGVANEMAEKHVANVLPRNDTIAGPLHRRGDQVLASAS